MKLQIDTDNKTIKIERDINLDELFKNLKKLFPDNTWKEYKLETNAPITYWSNPIYVQNYPVVNPVVYPWWNCGQPICDYNDVKTYTDPNIYINNSSTGNLSNNINTLTVNSSITYKHPEFQTLTSNKSETVEAFENRGHVYCVEI